MISQSLLEEREGDVEVSRGLFAYGCQDKTDLLMYNECTLLIKAQR